MVQFCRMLLAQVSRVQGAGQPRSEPLQVGPHVLSGPALKPRVDRPLQQTLHRGQVGRDRRPVADGPEHDGLAAVVLDPVDESQRVEEDLLRRDRVRVAADDPLVRGEGVECLVAGEDDEAVAEQPRLEDRSVLLNSILVEAVVVAEDRERLTQPWQPESTGWEGLLLQGGGGSHRHFFFRKRGMSHPNHRDDRKTQLIMCWFHSWSQYSWIFPSRRSKRPIARPFIVLIGIRIS